MVKFREWFVKHGKGVKITLAILTLIVLTLAIYFTFFFYYTCKDDACFKAHQERCVKTKFIRDSDEATWSYLIKGKDSGNCKIEVRLILLKRGNLDKRILEEKEMICFVSRSSQINPEQNLENCHGLLKEELQNQIIQRLHKYIIDNVGQIGEELQKAI